MQIIFGKNVYIIRYSPTLELRKLWRWIISRSGHIMYGRDRNENWGKLLYKMQLKFLYQTAAMNLRYLLGLM
jgi:hypothetical protein